MWSLAGSRELLRYLIHTGIPCTIGTSGRTKNAQLNIEAPGVDQASIPMLPRHEVKYTKPNPDIFLTAAARLNISIETSVVVGDAIWGMLAARRARFWRRRPVRRLRPGRAGTGRRRACL